MLSFYELKKFKYTDYFREWLGIDSTALKFIIDLHKNKNFWEIEDWNLKLWKFKCLSKKRNIKKSKLSVKKIEKKMRFISNDKIMGKNKIKYYIIGKGYP